MPRTASLSIVIPAYNEEARIGKTLAQIRKHVPHAELIVVDDGSSDGTVALARRAGAKVLVNERNRGKGYSVRRGMLAAQGGLILFSDADLSTPITELPRFLSLARDHDVVIGSRSVTGSRVVVHQPLYRELIGKTFNLLVQVMAVPGIKDTQCGFKLFSRDAARVFSVCRLDGFSFDVEALFVARKLGFSIKEEPVEWRNAAGSKVHPVRDALRMLRDLFVIRWNWMRGMYRKP
ncbi:glycosyl transferase [Candidatus Woesearchaeota archaeon CG_4_10_14_0_2_um_filter_57_5]|nr:MAG: hypothetical protein AUJ68_00480 [Candidatus Woesearchaeota archaeon CG1_02_57_44]PIZ48415.1 MAG: glycosyl transferase [Candidatus Woesearchaeota archaeon CG_4_10_14_0_2_um_filter_57_5]